MSDLYIHQALTIMNVQENDLISNFFADTNMNTIQKQLKNEVKKRTGHEISDQSCTNLFHAMLFVYRSFAKNVTKKINDELIYLNEIVIETVSPNVVSNVLQYISYLKDISKPREVLEHGESTSIKGKNSLKSQPYF